MSKSIITLFLASLTLVYLANHTCLKAAGTETNLTSSVTNSSSSATSATSTRPTLQRTERQKDLKSLPELKAALAVAKIQAKIFHDMGREAYDAKNYKEAAARFSEALDYDNSPQLMIWKAISLSYLKDTAGAKAAYRSVLSHSSATQEQKESALVGLSKMLQMAIHADEKRAFVAELGADASGVALGKLFGEAFNEDPKLNYAYAAAEAFSRAGDKTRAAAIYRKILTTPGISNQPVNIAPAQKWLKDHNFTETPKFTHLRSVSSKYVETASPSPQYQEELKPLNDVWGGQIKPAIANYLGIGDYYGTKVAGDLKTFKHRVTCPLGAGSMDFDALLLQGISYYVTKSNWSDKEIRDTLIPLKISVDQLPKEWPLVDQIKELAVTYLTTDAERAPYLLEFDKQGNLTMEGKLFDTTELSTMFSGVGWAIYVMSPDGKIYAASHRVSAFHHSSFLAASDVAGAGEMQVVKGKLMKISNKSGHYTPGAIQLVQTLEELAGRGLIGPALESVMVKVGGETKPGHFETLEWPGGAGDFLAKYRNSKPDNFMNVWKGQLKFMNDPFTK